MPPAVALPNYISSGILWRIFCQTGIFAGFSLHIMNNAVRISEAAMRRWEGRGKLYSIFCVVILYIIRLKDQQGGDGQDRGLWL